MLYRQRQDSAVHVPMDLNTKVERDAAFFRHFMAIPPNKQNAHETLDYYRGMSRDFWINRIMCSRLNTWFPFIRERKSLTGTLTSLWISLFALCNCLMVLIYNTTSSEKTESQAA